MRVELKTFQEETATRLLQEVTDAAVNLQRRGRRQAIAFSAPTGSGKTVVLGAFMEAMLSGGDLAASAEVAAIPSTTFLWLSDDPELNEQSRRRLRQIIEGVPPDRIEVIENSFDQPTLDAGKIYFLNYQKLRASSLLTRLGDARGTTIWETIAATGSARPGRFIVVMDEAHKGLGKTDREASDQRSLAAAFIAGGATTAVVRRPGGGTEPFPPVGIVLGVSATPSRFDAFLAGDTERTRHGVHVQAADVRLSGLIKERLVLYGLEEADPPVWTLLAEAVRQVRSMEAAWAAYSETHEKPHVVPLLMVQVRDAAGQQPSATPLDTVVQELRREWPDLAEDQVVHCFGEAGPITLMQGWTIRRENASDIAGNPSIRVVLFKTALNTGWDCPRAEVLMSFRTSDDATPIAQLVGRMVRTPLTERVEGIESLNAAHLYLPYFNRERLLRVRDALTADAGDAVPVEMAGETIRLVLRPDGRELLDALRVLPTEVVPTERALPELRRLFILARQLEQDGIGDRPVSTVSSALVSLLEGSLESILDETPDFLDIIEGRKEIELSALEVSDGTVGTFAGRRIAEVSETDIENAFRAACSVAGSEVAAAWLRKSYKPDDHDLLHVKLVYTELMRREAVVRRLTEEAHSQFHKLMSAHWNVVQGLSPARVAAYAAVQRSGRTVQAAILLPPEEVVVPAATQGKLVPGHLYVVPGSADEYRGVFNSWEEGVLDEERGSPRFLSFLRNEARKPWALSYAYELDGLRPGYPDFLVFRRDDKGGVSVDILEPHYGEDSVAKARGMARFSQSYGRHYGRIQMIREIDGVFRRLSFENEMVRGRVLAGMLGHQELLDIFRQLGTVGA